MIVPSGRVSLSFHVCLSLQATLRRPTPSMRSPVADAAAVMTPSPSWRSLLLTQIPTAEALAEEVVDEEEVKEEDAEEEQ